MQHVGLGLTAHAGQNLLAAHPHRPPVPEPLLRLALCRRLADQRPVDGPPKLVARGVRPVQAHADADRGAVRGHGEPLGRVVGYGRLLGFGEGPPDDLGHLGEPALDVGEFSGGGVAGEGTEDREARGEGGDVYVGGKASGGGGGGRSVVGVWGGFGGFVGVGGGRVEGHCCGWVELNLGTMARDRGVRRGGSFLVCEK